MFIIDIYLHHVMIVIIFDFIDKEVSLLIRLQQILKKQGGYLGLSGDLQKIFFFGQTRTVSRVVILFDLSPL